MADAPSNFGKKISLADAQEMMSEFSLLKGSTEIKLKAEFLQKPPQGLVKKTDEFMAMGNTHNAFIFSKELIMRFFDGSEKDADGKAVVADYLLVVLGAHAKTKSVNKESFKAGSFTVLTAGVNKVVEKPARAAKNAISVAATVVPPKFVAMDIPMPANEYPPKTIFP